MLPSLHGCFWKRKAQYIGWSILFNNIEASNFDILDDRYQIASETLLEHAISLYYFRISLIYSAAFFEEINF